MIQECLTSVSGHLKTWLEISLGANQRKESSSLPLLDPDQVVELQLFAEWIQTDKGSIAYFVLHSSNRYVLYANYVPQIFFKDAVFLFPTNC